MTCMAFSIDWMETNSYGPWKFTPPAKMLGQGRPLNESCAPSVPPQMGRTFGATSQACMACSTTSMTCICGSIFSFIL